MRALGAVLGEMDVEELVAMREREYDQSLPTIMSALPGGFGGDGRAGRPAAGTDWANPDRGVVPARRVVAGTYASHGFPAALTGTFTMTRMAAAQWSRP